MNTKVKISISFFMFVYCLGFTQESISESVEKTELIKSDAFNKMIKDEITYTIFGETSPTNGIKIDISKPDATITGFFNSDKWKSVLLGLNFKGGISDNNFSIFKGINKFNTTFKLTPSIHVVLPKNKAFYRKPTEKKIFDAKKVILEKRKDLKVDSFEMAAVIYNHYLGDDNKELHDKTDLPLTQGMNKEKKDILIHIINEIVDSKDKVQDNSLSPEKLLEKIGKLEVDTGSIVLKTYNQKVFDIYNKYKSINEKKEDVYLTEQITFSEKYWTKKCYRWISISPFVETQKINQYYTKFEEVDSLYFKSNYELYYGVEFSCNHYIIRPNRMVHYFKGGVNLSYSNNLSSLSSFTYEEKSPLSANPTTEKVKTGIAYNNSSFKEEIQAFLFAEYYMIPLETFFPGLYISTNLSNTKLNQLPEFIGRENDKFKLSGETGLVFNISNKEKGKNENLLSISGYVRFEDFTDSKRTNSKDNNIESREDFLERNLSFGIKVGVPITLPKKKIKNK